MNTPEAERLISLYLLDRASMTSDQMAELSGWIRQDPSHVTQYLASVQFHSMIRAYFREHDTATKAVLAEGSCDLDATVFEDELLQLLVMEENSPSLEAEGPRLDLHPEAIHAPAVQPAPHKVSRFWLSVAATSAAAVLLAAVWIALVPPAPAAVATLSDSLDAQWLGREAVLPKGHRFLDDGQPVRLARGFARLVFDNGAEVLVQGPSEIKIRAPKRMALSYGRACARIPEPARGFRIDAPRYGVVDLGTEMGVEVGVDGTASVLMYEGKASLVSQEASHVEAGVPVVEGQARTIQMNGRIEAAEIESDRFVRAFNGQSGILWRGQPLDLADVTGGGNGFGTGRPSWGVHVFSGLMVPVTFGPPRTGPVGYVQARGNDFIDGVFVPRGGSPATQVSSEGHPWNGCPRTSGALAAGPCNGGTVGISHDRLVLDGVQYGRPTHPALLVHSNLGITFDLRAIRRFCGELHKDLVPSRFKAVAGLSGAAVQGPVPAGQTRVADLWILVDGQERFRQIGLASGAAPLRIDLPLDKDAEFLTLVVTEGADQTVSEDWVILGDPVLTLSCN